MIDTLAKVINAQTCWRCRECDATWTLESQAAASATNRR